MADVLHQMVQDVALFDKQFKAMVDTGFLIFARFLGLMLVAPVFGRKDLPFNIKLGLALVLSWVFLWITPYEPYAKGLITTDNWIQYSIQLFTNVTIGALIGFIGTVIMEAISAAGAMMNNQVGLSSAMMFDPSSRQQVALIEKIFSFMALLIFINIGGIYWILDALHRSFEVFPLYIATPDIAKQVSLDYIIQITGNSITIGTQLVAPVMVVTMAVDLILGIVNRTAQQIQVFQLSFGLKPSIGMAAFLATLPIFVKLIENYLNDYSKLF